MKAVLTLRRKVNIIIDAPKLAITMYGVALLRPVAPAPITTGSNGKMHGAETVSIPAKNEITKNVILSNYSFAMMPARFPPDHFSTNPPLASISTNVC